MTGYEAYCFYLAIKRHFMPNGNYDFFKKQGRVRTSVRAYHKRTDWVYFEKLARVHKIEDFKNLCVSNMIMDLKIAGGHLCTTDAEKVYTEWKKKQQSLSYFFQNDLDFIRSEINTSKEFDALFLVGKNTSYPPLYVFVDGGHICIETFIILNKFLNFFPHFDSQIQDAGGWSRFQHKCIQYEPFISLDENRMKSILSVLTNVETMI
jgi:hypothetical protein